MNVLFFMRHSGYARNFGSTLDELVRRGHQVHVALGGGLRPWMATGDPVQELAQRHPGITVDLSPPPAAGGWAVLARQTRAALDYLRYFGPEYTCAPKLRARAGRAAPSLVRWLLRAPAVRGPRGRAALGHLLRAIERLVRWSPELDAYLDRQRADLVLVTPLVELGAPQADILRAARARGIPAVLCVASWDNLTNKGLIRDVPDLLTVWNEDQRREAVELHGVPAERVAATGAQSYDHWFTWTPSTTREAHCARAGLDPALPYLLYLCSSPFIAPEEVEHVRELFERLRGAGGQLADCGLLVRPHPQNARQWKDVDLTTWGPSVAVWPRGGADPVNRAAREKYFDSLFHAAAVVGVNTSALIESAIVGRAVHTLLAERFADTQAGTLHFEHLAGTRGGLLRTARSWAEHLVQLDEAISQDSPTPERNRRFLEAFVRPHGLDLPAAPILVDALERTACAPALPAQPRPAASARALASALAVLAGTADRAARRRRRAARRRGNTAGVAR